MLAQLTMWVYTLGQSGGQSGSHPNDFCSVGRFNESFRKAFNNFRKKKQSSAKAPLGPGKALKKSKLV